MFKLKNKAFTLAEVLITLSIIGVIAAMTIPSLINNIQDQEYKTRWKKTYAVVDNAVRMVATNNGGSLLNICDMGWPDSQNCLKDEMIKYLNISTSCQSAGEMRTNDCGYSSPKVRKLNGTPDVFAMNWDAGIVLTNGVILNIYSWGSSNEGPIVGRSYGSITIDTNGAKEPNQLGKDVFFVHITEAGIKPVGAQGDYNDTNRETNHRGCDLNADPDAGGYTCAADCLIDNGKCKTSVDQ